MRKRYKTMKNLHSICYYEKRLAELERVADSIGYAINDNADYIRATAILPLTFKSLKHWLIY